MRLATWSGERFGTRLKSGFFLNSRPSKKGYLADCRAGNGNYATGLANEAVSR